MNEGRLHRFLCRFADIRTEETRAALYFFLYFFLITFPAYIIKPAKESLLISDVRPGWWPYADLVTAVLIGLVVVANAWLLQKLPRRTYLNAILFVFITNLAAFWFIFDFQARTIMQTPIGQSAGFGWIGVAWFGIQESWPGPIILFCFWADVFIATSVTQFWIAVNDVFHPHEAKRMVSFFVGGGLLGGIGGALLTALLVRAVSTIDLLLVAGGILFLTITLVNLIYSERKKIKEGVEFAHEGEGGKVKFFESFHIVRKDSYLRNLSGVLASAMIVAALINFQFKIVLKASIDNNDDRTAFIGGFMVGILVLSFVFHVFMTGRVLKKFNIQFALLLAPLFLLLGSLSLLLIPAAGLVIWVCGLRGSDKIFDNTVSQAVRELLYIPVPSDIKYKAKIFIDMFINKFAAGIGAVIYLLLFYIFRFREKIEFDVLAYGDISALLKEVGGPVKIIGFVVAAIGVVWIILIVRIYRGHIAKVAQRLKELWIPGRKVVDKHVDVDVTKNIFDTLQSREQSPVLFLMNLFQLIQMRKLPPEFKELLSFESDEMKARSLEARLDVGGEVGIEGAEEIMAEMDFINQIQEIFSLDSYMPVIESHLSDLVRKKPGSEVDRMEAAKLIGMFKTVGKIESSPGIMETLGVLIQDESPEVLNYALSSAAVYGREEHIPLIIRQLENPLIKQQAQDTLVKFGAELVDELKQVLHNPEESITLKKEVPGVLARLESQKAADVLFTELCQGQEDLEAEIIEALYILKSGQPDLRFKVKKVMREILCLIRKCYLLLLEPGEEGSAAQGVLDSRLKARLDLRIKKIFELLTLAYPPKDIDKAYQNIYKGTKASVDYSLALLDNILDKDLKAFLFPLIENLPVEERIRRLTKLRHSLENKLQRNLLKRSSEPFRILMS